MIALPRWSRILLYILGLTLLAAFLFLYIPLRMSLPDTNATMAVSGLAKPAAVQRDALGYPRISAGNREEAAFVTGYVHSQERFFQMDLLRRTAAGELAELFGANALPLDRKNRLHRLRTVAREALEKLPPRQRRIIDSYTLGVLRGLQNLSTKPFEYHLLKTHPQLWQAEDSILVMAAMSLALQPGDGEPDRSRDVVRQIFSEETAAWLLSPADDFAAPLDGPMSAAPPLPETPRLKDSKNISRVEKFSPSITALEKLIAQNIGDTGSNAFAIAAPHVQGNGALVAGDMHLGLGVPNIWFRLQLAWFGLDERIRIVAGVSLPGLPGIAAGSNGAVAWALTNANIDNADLVALTPDPNNPAGYKTASGSEQIQIIEETIHVKDAAPETLRIEQTRWGPIIGTDIAGRKLALKWLAHDPAAYDLSFMHLEEAGSARAALAIAKNSGIPQQNFVTGDRDGRIGWTIAGRIPRRTDHDGSRIVESDAPAAEKLWDGFLGRGEFPQVFAPENGRIWSANARSITSENAAILGDGGYVLSSRAAELRDRVNALTEATPEAALEIQLSTRARHLDRWQKLLVGVAASAKANGSAEFEALQALVEKWDGHANAESASYRVIREFRDAVLQGVAGEVFAPCYRAFPEFNPTFLTLDRITYALASERPAAWHSKGREGWDALLTKAAKTVLENAGGEKNLAAYTWGKRNRLAMRHPLSSASPVLAWLLDMPEREMSGDFSTLNAQSPKHGPSVRFAVIPSREEEGILHMPGGQSGHPLSSFFSAGHDDWAEGKPSPFHPGRIEQNLSLRE